MGRRDRTSRITLADRGRARPRPRAGAAALLTLTGLLVAALAVTSAASAGHRVARRRSLAHHAAAIVRTASLSSAGFSRGRWIATWGASPQSATSADPGWAGFDNASVRNVVFTSIGGSGIRVRLTNVFGDRPLQIAQATVAVASTGASTVPAEMRRLTFHGRRSVVIAPGQEAISDPVALPVQPLERLAVTVYLPRPTGPPTLHALARQASYIAAGDHAIDPSGRGFGHRTYSWYFLDDIDVLGTRRDVAAVVAIGDSITDGVGSPIDANARWPNDLARRLQARSGPVLGVVDAGIGGNRILHAASCCGPDALSRFRRDVLSQPGVRTVILLEGINDIGMSHSRTALTAPHTPVSAAQIIAGYLRIIREAHADGLRILGGTLTPFHGARYWTPKGEAERDAVNRWIRTSGAFDGVIDFAAALADPHHPQQLNPAYDSGDHLHPNALGYRAMADAVRLRLLLAGS